MSPQSPPSQESKYRNVVGTLLTPGGPLFPAALNSAHARVGHHRIHMGHCSQSSRGLPSAPCAHTRCSRATWHQRCAALRTGKLLPAIPLLSTSTGRPGSARRAFLVAHARCLRLFGGEQMQQILAAVAPATAAQGGPGQEQLPLCVVGGCDAGVFNILGITTTE